MARRRADSSSTFDTSAATTGDGPGAAAPSWPSRDDNGINSYATATAAATATATPKQPSDYVKYLLSYEGMVRHQDLENEATLGHVTGAFDRIRALGGEAKKDANGRGSDTTSSVAAGEILTYPQMRRCLLRMGVGWDRCSAGGDLDYEDDVSVLSFESASSSLSGAFQKGGGRGGKKDKVVATDSQLILLLMTLVETEERHRAMMAMEEDGDEAKEHQWRDRGLFLPDFIQAYKLIVTGMQSMKSVPDHDLRDRLRERTLGMMRPFGPDSKIYNYNPLEDKSKKVKRDFSDGELKKLILSKDTVLTKMVEDHEHEMDALASSMEELRLRERRARAASKRRRDRLRWAVTLLAGILLVAGTVVEVQRRESLAREIASTRREAERLADASKIAGLEREKLELEKSLEVIAGKIRYQVGRNEEAVAKMEEVRTQIDDIGARESAGKEELEQCLASHAELKEAVKGEEARKRGAEEELVWCGTRLHSRERELNELEHVGVAARGDHGEKAALATSSTMGGDDDAPAESDKPVYLEMKYNKSIRNAMRLRQAYSAAAGLAASLLVRGWVIPVAVPAIAKLFAPKAVLLSTPPPPLPSTRDAEMIVLDGIAGSSIAFLLIQAVAAFLMPL